MLTQPTVAHLRSLRLDGMARAFEEQLTQPLATPAGRSGRIAVFCSLVARPAVTNTSAPMLKRRRVT